MKLLDLLSGRKVASVEHDWGLVLNGDGWKLRIIGVFEESRHDSNVLIDPEIESVGWDLVGVTIDAAIAAPDGTLTISFHGEPRWSVPPSNEYEAWDFSSPQGRLVCAIGGTVAEWRIEGKG